MTAPLRILVCPQEFKGSLTAFEAAAAIAAGARRAEPEAEVVESPLADGGPGTAAILAAARGGELAEAEVTGPLGGPSARALRAAAPARPRRRARRRRRGRRGLRPRARRARRP